MFDSGHLRFDLKSREEQLLYCEDCGSRVGGRPVRGGQLMRAVGVPQVV